MNAAPQKVDVRLAQLPELLSAVAAGHTIELVEDDRTIAIIVPSPSFSGPRALGLDEGLLGISEGFDDPMDLGLEA